MIVKLLTEHHLEFLSLKGGCRGSSESTLVKMSNCWKSHAVAQIFILSFSGRSAFFEKQQLVQSTPTPAPSNMSFALITVPEGSSVTRCPAATGNDKDDVSTNTLS